MITSGAQIINHVAEAIQVNQVDLVRDSLTLYLEEKLKILQSELFELKGKYEIETLDDFEALYKTGKIEEDGTWKDYQQFDNLTHKTEKLYSLIKHIESLFGEEEEKQ